MPEGLFKFATGYCLCGLTFDTRRSKAARYEDAIEIVRRSARRHIANPAELEVKPHTHHAVTIIETRVTTIT